MAEVAEGKWGTVYKQIAVEVRRLQKSNVILYISNSSALRLNCIKIIKKKVPKFLVPSLIVIHSIFCILC